MLALVVPGRIAVTPLAADIPRPQDKWSTCAAAKGQLAMFQMPAGSSANQSSLFLFFSYAREDRSVVEGIRALARTLGAEAWMDANDLIPPADYWTEIKLAIGRADAFVFFVSAASLAARDTCLRELDYAVAHGKRVVPVQLEDVSGIRMPTAIARPHWVIADDHTRMNAATESLIAAAMIDLDRARAHARLLQRATEWRSNPRGSQLLGRSEVESAEHLLISADDESTIAVVEVQRAYIAASRVRLRRRARTMASIAAIVGGSLLALLAVAIAARDDASQKARESLSRALAAEAEARAGASPQTSAELALRAWRTDPTEVADAALRHVYATYRPSRAITISSIAEVNTIDPAINAITALTFSDDGKYLVTGSGDGTLRVWRWPSLTRIGLQEQVPEPITSVSFSQNDDYIVTGNHGGEVAVWEWRRPSPPHIISTGQGEIRAAELNPVRPGQLAVAGSNGDIRLWSWKRRRFRTLSGHDDGVRAMRYALLPGTLLTGGSDGTIRMWAVPPSWVTTELERVQPSRSPITSMAVRGEDVVYGGGDGIVRIWEWLKHQEVARVDAHGTPQGVALSEDRIAAAVGSRATVWYPDLGPPESFRGSEARITSLAFSPTGDNLVTGGEDGVLRVWAVASRANPVTVLFTKQEAFGVAWSHNGSEIAVAGGDGATRIFNLQHPHTPPVILRQTAAIRGSISDDVSAVAYSPTQRIVATGARDGMVRVWELGRHLRVIRSTRVSPREVLDLTFSPDGRYLAAASDNRVEVWPWENRTDVIARGPQSPAAAVATVVFGPSDEVVASADSDGRIYVWRWKKNMAKVLRGADHQEVSALAFSPDGRYIATGTLTGDVLRVWRIASGTSVEANATGSIYGGAQWGTTFSPDGRTVISLGQDGTLNIWPWKVGARPISLRGYARVAVSEPFIEAAAFNPGRTAIAAAGNGTVVVRQCIVCGATKRIAASAERQLR